MVPSAAWFLVLHAGTCVGAPASVLDGGSRDPACSLTPGWKPAGDAASTGAIWRGKSGLIRPSSFPAAFSLRDRLHVVHGRREGMRTATKLHLFSSQIEVHTS